MIGGPYTTVSRNLWRVCQFSVTVTIGQRGRLNKAWHAKKVWVSSRLDCDSSYFGMSVRDFGKSRASRTSPQCASWNERDLQGLFQTTKMDKAGHGGRSSATVVRLFVQGLGKAIGGHGTAPTHPYVDNTTSVGYLITGPSARSLRFRFVQGWQK